jgi:DNA-directed RNA polymerase subunit RPC12/RpoP
MKFKCNHCERQIDHRLWGDPEIKCVCGARYIKTITVTVEEKSNAQGHHGS